MPSTDMPRPARTDDPEVLAATLRRMEVELRNLVTERDALKVLVIDLEERLAHALAKVKTTPARPASV